MSEPQDKLSGAYQQKEKADESKVEILSDHTVSEDEEDDIEEEDGSDSDDGEDDDEEDDDDDDEE